MTTPRCFAALSAFALVSFVTAKEQPTLSGVSAAMDASIAANEIAGAVTLVTTKDKIVHLETTGLADIASKKPMSADTLFWIASMTKPITGVAVLMLQDEGKLNIADPVAKYLPEFASLKTPSGKPANLTITQILTHTSGLGEATGEQSGKTKTLADLIPFFLAAPMQYEPGERWKYTQSAINTAGRIVEVISGKPFEVFLEERLFSPLGMKDTGFYPEAEKLARMATAYRKDATTGQLVVAPPRRGLGARDYPPLANGGLYSTAGDYARFAQMLLNGGELNGKRFLSAASLKLLNTPQTGDLPTGFFQGAERGDFGANYGWGIGTCVLRTPHSGVAEVLSSGTYGHGGAWGTQAWIDPIKGLAYILMVQRAGHPNSDGSDFRRDFQKAAASALSKR
jgi:CubicO group peptidase (beta-lactamase class C family)